MRKIRDYQPNSGHCPLHLPVIITAIFLLSGVANANENGHEQLPHHHWAVFAGAGFEKENGHSENGSAIGLKYELKFHRRWSIGTDVEKLFGSGTERSWIIAIPLSFHPTEHLRIFAGPGYEFQGKKDKTLLRTGVSYEFDLKNGWDLSPEFIVDFLEGGAKTYVAGISIGHGF